MISYWTQSWFLCILALGLHIYVCQKSWSYFLQKIWDVAHHLLNWTLIHPYCDCCRDLLPLSLENTVASHTYSDCGKSFFFGAYKNPRSVYQCTVQHLGAVSRILHDVPFCFQICIHLFSVVLLVVHTKISQTETWNSHWVLVMYNAAVGHAEVSCGIQDCKRYGGFCVFPQTHLYSMPPVALHTWREGGWWCREGCGGDKCSDRAHQHHEHTVLAFIHLGEFTGVLSWTPILQKVSGSLKCLDSQEILLPCVDGSCRSTVSSFNSL